jgi:hypothetical protein
MSMILSPSLRLCGPEPRINVCPPGIVDTIGPLSTKLCARASLILDPWQRDSVDLMLSRVDSGQWACFEYGEVVSRQQGKGSILEARAMTGMVILKEKLIIWTAHQDRTVEQSFNRMCERFDALGLLRTPTYRDRPIQPFRSAGRLVIKHKITGQEIRFMTRSAHSGRGFSADCLFYDEAYSLTDGEVAASLPTMSAMPNPQVILTSTPPLSGGTAGPMYSMRARAEKGECEGMGYRDWGLEGTLEGLMKRPDSERIEILSNVDNWRKANPAMGYRISETFTRKEYEMLSHVDFARERLGIWPAQLAAGGDIDMTLWNLLSDADSRREGDVAMSVDVSPRRDWACIGMAGLRKDTLEHGQIVDYHPGTEWIIGKMLEAKDILDPVCWAMGRGTFLSLKDELDKAGFTESVDPDRPRRGDIFVVVGAEMAAACGQAIDVVKQRNMRHPNQTQLNSSVAGAKLRQVGDVVAWSRKETDVDTTPIVAWTLARYGFTVRAAKVKNKYNPLNNIW